MQPELVDGTDTFEKVLSEIEGLAANAIKKIISERTWPLDPKLAEPWPCFWRFSSCADQTSGAR